MPWIEAGYQRMENFKTDFLTGRPPIVTDMHFKKAVEEIKKSGDLDLLGKVWLTRMALQVAVLDEPEEGDYPRIEAAQSVPANRNFYLFLKGDRGRGRGSSCRRTTVPFFGRCRVEMQPIRELPWPRSTIPCRD